ncbi:MAG: hypothetical protein COA50_06770 [Flavobacteriaceae bacterium]|nr:MAG: hypothetical protein COA50_06770 [Flavobacteriaceae bacterium]
MLKGANKYLCLFLLIIWSTFIVWEIQVREWLSYETEFIFRADLVIILPILILLSLYVTYIIMNQKNKRS